MGLCWAGRCLKVPKEASPVILLIQESLSLGSVVNNVLNACILRRRVTPQHRGCLFLHNFALAPCDMLADLCILQHPPICKIFPLSSFRIASFPWQKKISWINKYKLHLLVKASSAATLYAEKAPGPCFSPGCCHCAL